MYIFDIVTVQPSIFLQFSHKILKAQISEKRKGAHKVA